MEKKIKKPKQKMLYEVRSLSRTSQFSIYVIAKDEIEAKEKAKVIYPYMAISSITLHFSIFD